MSDRRHRLFFALWPDEEAAGHLELLARELAPRGAKPVSAHKLHLTLAFIGAVPGEDIARLVAAAGRVRAAAFDMRLDRVGFWPQGGVVYAGCRQPPSGERRLFEALKHELAGAGFAPEPRPHVPHVTLARRVRGFQPPRLGSPITWPVDEFALVESHLHPTAASYRILERWPLDEPLDADGIN